MRDYLKARQAQLAYHVGRLAWWLMPEPYRTKELDAWRSRLSPEDFEQRLSARGMKYEASQ